MISAQFLQGRVSVGTRPRLPFEPLDQVGLTHQPFIAIETRSFFGVKHTYIGIHYFSNIGHSLRLEAVIHWFIQLAATIQLHGFKR